MPVRSAEHAVIPLEESTTGGRAARRTCGQEDAMPVSEAIVKALSAAERSDRGSEGHMLEKLVLRIQAQNKDPSAAIPSAAIPAITLFKEEHAVPEAACCPQ